MLTAEFPSSYAVCVPRQPSKAELDEFLGRAVAEVIVREEFASLLRSGESRLRIKQGFDPTKPNLHIGHTVGLRKLRTLSQWGHEIVLIIGDWTTQIGDPTDKDETRPTMTHEQVMKNAQTYIEQFHKIVPRENTRIVLQSEWFGKFGLRDVIDLASKFTAQQMLQREEFRKRMEKKTPIPIKDLLYPLMQAYDSVAIEADVELGGTDQLFNILAGRELQTQLGQRAQQVFIVPLLEGLDGEKMSKSKPKTGIWLTDEPNEVYGKVMAIDDNLMPHYFEWATDLPWDAVKKINATLATADALGRKAMKEKLAWQITSELHSPEKADAAADAFRRQFSEGELPTDMPVITLEADGAKDINIVELLMKGLRKSRSESRRLVEQGGVSVDGSKTNESSRFPTRGTYVVKYGKRSYARVSWR